MVWLKMYLMYGLLLICPKYYCSIFKNFGVIAEKTAKFNLKKMNVRESLAEVRCSLMSTVDMQQKFDALDVHSRHANVYQN